MLRSIGILFLTSIAVTPTQAPTQTPTTDKLAFDAVSIKPSRPNEETGWGTYPDGFKMTAQPIHTAVMMAYFPFGRLFGTSGQPISNEPPWMKKDLYDIDAKYDEATVDLLKTKSSTERQEINRPMLQAILHERCGLVAHMTMVDQPVYELVIGKHGAKMKETQPNDPPPEHALPIAGDAMMVPIYPPPAKDQIVFFRTSMPALAMELSTSVDRQVIDRTGLTGRYTFAVPRILRDRAADAAAPDPGPSVDLDLSEAGLTLRPAKAPQQLLVIDHIDKPTEN